MGSRKKRDDVQTLSVSDAALCQRCPRLLAYRGEGERGAWKVGIEGSGEKYGSLFHKHIAGAFFDAAADPQNSLRDEIRAVLKAIYRKICLRLLKHAILTLRLKIGRAHV